VSAGSALPRVIALLRLQRRAIQKLGSGCIAQPFPVCKQPTQNSRKMQAFHALLKCVHVPRIHQKSRRFKPFGTINPKTLPFFLSNHSQLELGCKWMRVTHQGNAAWRRSNLRFLFPHFVTAIANLPCCREVQTAKALEKRDNTGAGSGLFGNSGAGDTSKEDTGSIKVPV